MPWREDMPAWWKGECLSPHPHPPVGASCPAVALAHPLPADQSLSAAPHPAQLHLTASGLAVRMLLAFPLNLLSFIFFHPGR